MLRLLVSARQWAECLPGDAFVALLASTLQYVSGSPPGPQPCESPDPSPPPPPGKLRVCGSTGNRGAPHASASASDSGSRSLRRVRLPARRRHLRLGPHYQPAPSHVGPFRDGSRQHAAHLPLEVHTTNV